MKIRTAFVLVIAAVVLSIVGYSNAAVLGTIEHKGIGSGLGEFSEITFTLSYPQPAEAGADLSSSLIWDPITADDVSKTTLATSETHQNFDTVLAYLTNGIDDILFVIDSHTLLVGSMLGDPPLVLGADPSTQFESALINGSQDGVDFEGYTIDSIALTINALSFDYDADGIKGGQTSFSYDATYTIYGEAVPEPAALSLLVLGGLGLLRRRSGQVLRRRRRFGA